MILNPLDFKLNTDLTFLKLGLLLKPEIRSTANVKVNVDFGKIIPHLNEIDNETPCTKTT